MGDKELMEAARELGIDLTPGALAREARERAETRAYYLLGLELGIDLDPGMPKTKAQRRKLQAGQERAHAITANRRAKTLEMVARSYFSYRVAMIRANRLLESAERRLAVAEEAAHDAGLSSKQIVEAKNSYDHDLTATECEVIEDRRHRGYRP